MTMGMETALVLVVHSALPGTIPSLPDLVSACVFGVWCSVTYACVFGTQLCLRVWYSVMPMCVCSDTID